MILRWLADSDDHGYRAVDVLRRRLGVSATLARRIRTHGSLTRNGDPARMIDRVYDGDLLLADDGRDVPSAGWPEVPGAELIYGDAWLAAYNKPAGMLTHPAYTGHTGALTACTGSSRAHPVSRLDRGTSGLILLAADAHTHHLLVSRNKPRKRYLAMVHGKPPAPDGLINLPISRDENSIIRRRVYLEGSPARSLWTLLRHWPNPNVSLLRLDLLTGRTHQLRLHCAAIGCPIVGDSLYGADFADAALDRLIGRQALHAAQIDLVYPYSELPIRLTAPLPQDWLDLLGAVRRAIASETKSDGICQ